MYDPDNDKQTNDEIPCIRLRTKSVHLGLITDDERYRKKTIVQRLLADPKFGTISNRISIYPSSQSVTSNKMVTDNPFSIGQDSVSTLSTAVENSKCLQTENSIKGILRTKSVSSLPDLIERQPTKLESLRENLNVPEPGLPVRRPLTDTLQTLNYIRNNMGLKSALTAIGKSEVGFLQRNNKT